VPIYVYECDSCNGRFEYSQSLAEAPKTVCETCSGKLQKIIVPIAFHLKGGGWYKDLYSSSKGGGESKGGGSEATKAESTKSESKSDTGSKPSSSGGGGGSSGGGSDT